MLAYHNSVFLLFVVDWFAFASGFTGRISKEIKRDGQPLWSFLLVLLIFSRAALFNFAILSHVLYEWLS